MAPLWLRNAKANPNRQRVCALMYKSMETTMSARSNEGLAEDGELFRTHIGGSAVIEGVMMRGKLNWAVAVRQDNGQVYTEAHDLPDPAGRPGWWSWPLVRGCVSFVQSMQLSLKAMNIAAEHAYPDEDGDDDAAANAKDDKDDGMHLDVLIASAVGAAVGVGVFLALPVFLSNLIMGELTPENSVAWNLVEALARIALLVGYIWLCGRFPEMARVFGYHGAEHQTIHCYEHGDALTPQNAARYSRLHVRCGTAFLVMTVTIAIIVHSLVPVAQLADAWGIQGIARNLFIFASRLVMLPLVAGASYEVTVKWAGAHPDNPLVKIVLWPGMQMQRITTNVADQGMLECAIAALELVRDREIEAGLDTADSPADASGTGCSCQ